MSIQNQKLAIFKLKRGHNHPAPPKDFLDEAESIVQAYLQSKPISAPPAKQPINLILLLSCITLAIALGVQILG